ADGDQENDQPQSRRFAARLAEIAWTRVFGAISALAVAADSACKRLAHVACRRDELSGLLRPPPTVFGVWRRKRCCADVQVRRTAGHHRRVAAVAVFPAMLGTD